MCGCLHSLVGGYSHRRTSIHSSVLHTWASVHLCQTRSCGQDSQLTGLTTSLQHTWIFIGAFIRSLTANPVEENRAPQAGCLLPTHHLYPPAVACKQPQVDSQHPPTQPQASRHCHPKQTGCTTCYVWHIATVMLRDPAGVLIQRTTHISSCSSCRAAAATAGDTFCMYAFKHGTQQQK